MKIAPIRIFFLLLSLLVLTRGVAQGNQFKIAIMQDEKNAVEKYQPLVVYLKSKDIDVSFVEAISYSAAAKMFVSGAVDAMFSGSGVAGTMIIKGLATPLVRAVNKDGFSTYGAVIVAPKGSPKCDGSAEFFSKKRVVFCELASSGEVYFRSIDNIDFAKAVTIKAASHSAAIDTVSRGSADIAIVKNRVWERIKAKYPDLVVVGEDKPVHPDNTLIVSKKADPQIVAKVSDALLSLKNDKSVQAWEVREQLNVREYIKTTESDFKYTFMLLKKAGVDKSFNFTFW